MKFFATRTSQPGLAESMFSFSLALGLLKEGSHGTVALCAVSTPNSLIEVPDLSSCIVQDPGSEARHPQTF